MPFFASKTCPNPAAATAVLAADFARWLGGTRGRVNVALSGGRTPALFFAALAASAFRALPWRNVHFFWADERWVPHDSPESNFGNAWRLFFAPAGIPMPQIHPMLGVCGGPAGEIPAAAVDFSLFPEGEWAAALAAAAGYSGRLRTELPMAEDGCPVFDLILLGMGADGHTASLFPGAPPDPGREPCAAVRHPATGATRLTLTLPVLNRARQVVFLVTGADKRATLREMRRHPASSPMPAVAVRPFSGAPAWYLDAAAEG